MGHPRITITMLDLFFMISCQTGGLDGGVSLNTLHVHHTSHHYTFLWGYLEDRVYAMKPATDAGLRTAIEHECTQIPRGLFCHVSDSIALCCQQCMDHNGCQFENRQ